MPVSRRALRCGCRAFGGGAAVWVLNAGFLAEGLGESGQLQHVVGLGGAAMSRASGEAGHADVDFLSNVHLDGVGDDPEAPFESTHVVPDHRAGARLGAHCDRNRRGRVLE